jgi:hypothetical protein
MDFPHVDERTDEKFTRLWPLLAENVKVKEAAKADPTMLEVPNKEEKAAAGGFHYKLYEGRIPMGVDADKSFGGWATEEARRASVEEAAAPRKGNEIGAKQKQEAAEKMYPQEIRYFPAVNAEEGKNREAFNQIVSGIVAERDAAAKASNPEHKVERADVIKYNNSAEVKAFVSKIGPIPELAYWQTDEAKAAWAREGESLKQSQEKTTTRAKEVVDRVALQGKGEDFQAKYSAKGLVMPPKSFAKEREAVEAEIRKASTEDLQKVRAVSEREFKALEKKLYAIQITAAKKNDPSLSTEQFNAKSPDERRDAAKPEAMEIEEYRRMVRTKDGFFRLNAELSERGEHMSVAQARDLKTKGESQEQAKPVDEKGKSMKPTAEPQAEKSQGRQGSRGAAHAAALANSLNR